MEKNNNQNLEKIAREHKNLPTLAHFQELQQLPQSEIPSDLVEHLATSWKDQIVMKSSPKTSEQLFKKLEETLQQDVIDPRIVLVEKNKTLSDLLHEDFSLEESQEDDFLDLAPTEDSLQKTKENTSQIFRFPQFFPDYKTTQPEETLDTDEETFFDFTIQKNKPSHDLKDLILSIRAKREAQTKEEEKEDTLNSVVFSESPSTEETPVITEESHLTEEKKADNPDSVVFSESASTEEVPIITEKSYPEEEKANNPDSVVFSESASTEEAPVITEKSYPEEEKANNPDSVVFLESPSTEEAPVITEESYPEEEKADNPDSVVFSESPSTEEPPVITEESYPEEEKADNPDSVVFSQSPSTEETPVITEESHLTEEKSIDSHNKQESKPPKSLIDDLCSQVIQKHFSVSEFVKTDSFTGGLLIEPQMSWQEFKAQYQSLPQVENEEVFPQESHLTSSEEKPSPLRSTELSQEESWSISSQSLMETDENIISTTSIYAQKKAPLQQEKQALNWFSHLTRRHVDEVEMLKDGSTPPPIPPTEGEK